MQLYHTPGWTNRCGLRAAATARKVSYLVELTRRPAFAARLILVLTLLQLSACGGDNGTGSEPGPAGPAPVASVEIGGTVTSLAVGDSVQLTASARDAAGAVLTGRTLVWASSDPTRATVSGTGLVTGLAPGAFTITVTVEGKQGAKEMLVAAERLTAVTAASDASPGARAAVAAVVSLSDSTSLADGKLSVPLATAQTLVVAVNSARQPIFVTLSSAAGPLQLGPRSTAIALVRMLLVRPGDASGLNTPEDRITSHPSFGVGVAALQASADAGKSFLESDAVVAALSRVAADLLGLASAQRASTPALRAGPLELTDGPGTSYRVVNHSRVALAVTATPTTPANAPRLADVVVDGWEYLPPADPVDVPGANGEVLVHFGHNAETQKRFALTAMGDVIRIGFDLTLGPALTPSGSAITGFAQGLIGADSYAAMQQPWPSNLTGLATVALKNLPGLVFDYTASTLKQHWLQTGTVLVVGTAAGWLSKAWTVVENIKTGIYYVDYVTYRSLDESQLVCQSDGVISPCVKSITLSPAGLTLGLGAAADLRPLVLSVSGEDITSKTKLEWSSSRPSVATVDQNGRVTALMRADTATITVRAGDKTASARVTVSLVGAFRGPAKFTTSASLVYTRDGQSYTCSWTGSVELLVTVSYTSNQSVSFGYTGTETFPEGTTNDPTGKCLAGKNSVSWSNTTTPAADGSFRFGSNGPSGTRSGTGDQAQVAGSIPWSYAAPHTGGGTGSYVAFPASGAALRMERAVSPVRQASAVTSSGAALAPPPGGPPPQH